MERLQQAGKSPSSRARYFEIIDNGSLKIGTIYLPCAGLPPARSTLRPDSAISMRTPPCISVFLAWYECLSRSPSLLNVKPRLPSRKAREAWPRWTYGRTRGGLRVKGTESRRILAARKHVIPPSYRRPHRVNRRLLTTTP